MVLMLVNVTNVSKLTIQSLHGYTQDGIPSYSARNLVTFVGSRILDWLHKTVMRERTYACRPPVVARFAGRENAGSSPAATRTSKAVSGMQGVL